MKGVHGPSVRRMGHSAISMIFLGLHSTSCLKALRHTFISWMLSMNMFGHTYCISNYIYYSITEASLQHIHHRICYFLRSFTAGAHGDSLRIYIQKKLQGLFGLHAVCLGIRAHHWCTCGDELICTHFNEFTCVHMNICYCCYEAYSRWTPFRGSLCFIPFNRFYPRLGNLFALRLAGEQWPKAKYRHAFLVQQHLAARQERDTGPLWAR